jgi:hypothetical protein
MKMKRGLVSMVLNLFGEAICQPCEAAHVHPHSEIGALRI